MGNKKTLENTWFSRVLAEKPGFEPGRHSTHPTPLAGEPLRPLGYFSMACDWRRERDSNPRCLSTSLVFKTSAFNHSAISPRQTSIGIISKKKGSVKRFFPGFGQEERQATPEPTENAGFSIEVRGCTVTPPTPYCILPTPWISPNGAMATSKRPRALIGFRE